MKRDVLFDIGNVLVKLRFDRGLLRLAALGGSCDPLALRGIYHSPLKLGFDRGAPDRASFLAQLARAIGAPGVDPGALVAAWVDIFDRWPEAEALLEEVLDRGHRVFLLSNTDALHMAELRRVIPAFARVHGAHLSFEARAMKPETAFFAGAIAQLGIEAASALFIDDLAENVAAARAAGLRAHHHTGDVDAVRTAIFGD